MNYFVSAEQSAYHVWQLELLIESFKALNLQDSLTIALASNPEPIRCPYSKNITSHKRIFAHPNVGRQNNSLYYNRIYSLHHALENKIIKPPLTIIHPDTILVKPISAGGYDLVFQLDESMTKVVDKDVEDLISEIQKVKIEKVRDWINLGDTICINKLPEGFTARVLSLTDFWIRNKKPWNHEKVAWVIALLEYAGHFSYHGTFELEGSLFDKLKSVIHYKQGLAPSFTKKMFSYEPDRLTISDPYQVLLENNFNKTTDYLQKIIKSYQEDKILPS